MIVKRQLDVTLRYAIVIIQLSCELSNINTLGKVIRVYYKVKKNNIYLIK
jgi:hypothetical protein